MLILYETPAGYVLLKVLKEKKLEKIEDIIAAFSSSSSASKVVSVQAFKQFKDSKEALVANDKLIKGLLPKTLKKFLEKNAINDEVQEKLAVADKRLGKVITEDLGLECLHGKKYDEIIRGVRSQLNTLVSGLNETEMKNMTLSLAHGLSRYKLKFSADKVDTMIIQAISLLEDLDKEINNYMMRLREWYGYHFPECGKIITDNLLYTRVIRKIGIRSKAADTDLSEIITDQIEKDVKEAAEISMGIDITEEDEEFIMKLADQILELNDYRDSLSEYLKNRMNAIAPNLTIMVGELVGAKLIAHAGSLVNLAKSPASTIQILGAEKALFRAMKTKHNTPKYGLIYQASMVGSANSLIKGKVARTLAAKCSVCIRVDALGESEEAEIGEQCKEFVERRIKFLENGALHGDGGKNFKKPHAKQDGGRRANGGGYEAETDFVMTGVPKIGQTFVKKRKQSTD
mmetsp:Transcript_82286/g.96280  ORF Transcript_82286/g.96280 Transcript_82286/m.96280 type:complete len:459 (-) Transcript_82286:180-1556(-)